MFTENVPNTHTSFQQLLRKKCCLLRLGMANHASNNLTFMPPPSITCLHEYNSRGTSDGKNNNKKVHANQNTHFTRKCTVKTECFSLCMVHDPLQHCSMHWCDGRRVVLHFQQDQNVLPPQEAPRAGA